MLRPWSPSPIAWSSAVSSSTWSISVCVALRMRSVCFMASFMVRASGGDPLAGGVEPERPEQLEVNRIARLPVRAAGGRADQLLLAVVEVDVDQVLVAELLDPPDARAAPAVRRSRRRRAQPQLLGAYADERGAF